MAIARQSSTLESGRLYDYIVTADWSSDVVLDKAYPGWAAGKPPKAARQITFFGGTMVLNDAQGNAVTLPQDLEKIPHNISPYSIDSTSTATGVLVIW